MIHSLEKVPEVSSARAISNGKVRVPAQSIRAVPCSREEVQFSIGKCFFVKEATTSSSRVPVWQKDILILSDTEVCHAHHIASGSKILAVTCCRSLPFQRCSVYGFRGTADGSICWSE